MAELAPGETDPLLPGYQTSKIQVFNIQINLILILIYLFFKIKNKLIAPRIPDV